MFTGIVEALANVEQVRKEGENIRAVLSCPFTQDLQIDQSILHDGVCLTVVEIEGNNYAVDIIHETLQKSNLKFWKVGKKVNIERSVTMHQRLDGHIVQGHIDTKAQCNKITDTNGSWLITFSYPEIWSNYLIPQGSISVNGVSLTIAKLNRQEFSVAIIPYTFEYTNFQFLRVNDFVNLEFDMIGKYVNRIMQNQE